MNDVQHLTILGDRQAGKTKLLVDVAVDEAGRQGRRVLFYTYSRDQEGWVLKLIEERARDLIGDDQVQKVLRSHGRERIFFASGGTVFFRLDNSDVNKSVDTHIIDDVSGGESCVGATRVFRAMMR